MVYNQYKRKKVQRQDQLSLFYRCCPFVCVCFWSYCMCFSSAAPTNYFLGHCFSAVWFALLSIICILNFLHPSLHIFSHHLHYFSLLIVLRIQSSFHIIIPSCELWIIQKQKFYIRLSCFHGTNIFSNEKIIKWIMHFLFNVSFPSVHPVYNMIVIYGNICCDSLQNSHFFQIKISPFGSSLKFEFDPFSKF